MWGIAQVLPNKFTKNYNISHITSHTSLHRESLITTKVKSKKIKVLFTAPAT